MTIGLFACASCGPDTETDPPGESGGGTSSGGETSSTAAPSSSSSDGMTVTTAAETGSSSGDATTGAETSTGGETSTGEEPPEDLACGCPVFDEDQWPTYPGCMAEASECGIVQVVDCEALGDTTDCWEIGTVSSVEVLDCVLGALEDQVSASYRVELGEGGFSNNTRHLHVDPRGQAVARSCAATDLEFSCDPASEGTVDTEAAAQCGRVEDPLERARCAWDLISFRTAVACE